MKLSAEQKAANKEASLLRQAAFRARNKELEQAKLAINVSSLKDAFTKANSEMDAILKARNDEEDSTPRPRESPRFSHGEESGNLIRT